MFSSIFGIILIIIQFFIPLFVLVYCYGRIAWILTRRIDSELNNTTSANTHADTFETARNNTIKTLLIVAICFIICWSNDQVYYTMYNLGYKVDWNGVYYKFTVLMVFLNSAVNPFIYLVKYKDYQMALRSCLNWNQKWDRKHVTTMNKHMVTIQIHQKHQEQETRVTQMIFQNKLTKHIWCFLCLVN